MPIETMILRFRDLSGNPGDTLKAHQHLIARSDKPYVWWGWWHKAGEAIPVSAFSELRRRSLAGGLDVYLFDSGASRLHRARLLDIQWDGTLEPAPAQEATEVPSYYGAKKCLAWFKFGDIESADLGEAALRAWTYVKVPELFSSGSSIYEPLYGKQVYSFEELRSQDRTVWFVRAYRESDPCHEIRIFDRYASAPSDFPEHVIESEGDTLLWLSDPHFSRDHHAFPARYEAHRRTLSEAVRKDYQEGYRGGSIACAIVSGDLTWKAAPEEFALAQDFLKEVGSWATLKPNRVLVTTGNHDVAFSSDPADKGQPVQFAPDEATRAFAAFYKDYFSAVPNQFLCSGRRLLLARCRPVDIVALNSSMLAQRKGLFQGHGYVGDDQLEFAASRMRWTKGSRDRAFRIVVLHHHLVPIIHREEPWAAKVPSTVFDGGALVRWIVDHRVDLVLHGHMHLPAVQRLSRPVDVTREDSEWHEFTVASLGSSGAEIGHTADRKNTYGIMEVQRDCVVIRVREITAEGDVRAEHADVMRVRLERR